MEELFDHGVSGGQVRVTLDAGLILHSGLGQLHHTPAEEAGPASV